MLKHKEYYDTTISAWADEMCNDEIISYTEHADLQTFIDQKRPPNALSRGHWWFSNDIKPKLSWIKEQIKLQP